MALALPTPGVLADLARAAAGQVIESAASLATVPVRVLGLLGQSELLMSRLTLLAERSEALIERMGEVVTDAEKAIGATKAVIANAALAAADARAAAEDARRLVASNGRPARSADL
ncbi:hypothetical protein [Krasilnikovia sp. MM14-A1259]|uniref:hypothetical protein n=1 Tax=Krasilnikovia sp. MM14-A1259 TaxID=3373539 RepID=UPI0037F666C6